MRHELRQRLRLAHGAPTRHPPYRGWEGVDQPGACVGAWAPLGRRQETISGDESRHYGKIAASGTESSGGVAMATAAPADGRKWTLPGRMERAARLVAEDELTDEAILARLRLRSRQTLHNWKRRPDFAARVAEHREAFRERALTAGFADKRARIAALNAMATDLLGDLRDKDYTTTIVKVSNSGEFVEVETLDKERIEAVRGCLDDIAREMGGRRADQAAGQEPPALLVLADPRLANIFEADWSDAAPAEAPADRPAAPALPSGRATDD
jgi:hypothetical protein